MRGLFYLPSNATATRGFQVGVGLGKVPTTQKTSVSRQGTGVRCGKDQVLGAVNQVCFLLGKGPP